MENPSDLRNPEEQNSIEEREILEGVNLQNLDNSHQLLRGNEENDIGTNKILLASVFIKDACNGHYGIVYKTDEKSLRSYINFNCYPVKFALHFVIFIHLSLAIFEPPAVEGYGLPIWAVILLESVCLFLYLVHVLYAASFSERKLFWMDVKNITLVVVISLIAIDMICFLCLYSNGINVIRWSRPLRPLFLINFIEFRQVRRAFRNIWRTMPDIITVLILLFLTIGLFALMALKLFGKRDTYCFLPFLTTQSIGRKLKYKNQSPYFGSLVDSFFDLYVLVTAANNPDVMIPAYNTEKLSALFFIVFITISMFIIMNIFLAVVYNNYRKNLKNEVKNCVDLKRKLLFEAFNLLKVKDNENFVIHKPIFSQLIKQIKPERSEIYASILWQVLDVKGENKIGKLEFLQIADLLNVEISEVKDRIIFLNMFFPQIYNSRMSKFIQRMVKMKYFRYCFDALIVINAILIALDINHAEWFFLIAFSIEILLKLYTFGSREFFKRFWNVFDFIVIGMALIWSVYDLAYKQEMNNKSHLEFLMVLRVLRLVKIIGGIPRFKIIITTIMHLGPSIVTYGCVLLVFQYMFAIVGIELFHGLIKSQPFNETFCGNPKLKYSDFWKADYCNLNFNNFLQAMIVMFELTVVNQWHVIALGYSQVSSKLACLYFMLYHIMCVVIVLSIFTAFVLEAFILEFNLSKRWHENMLEIKINELGLGLGSKPRQRLNTDADRVHLIADLDEDAVDADHNLRQLDPSYIPKEQFPNLGAKTDLRFHLSSGPKNVEDLLQRMFENEIEDYKDANNIV